MCSSDLLPPIPVRRHNGGISPSTVRHKGRTTVYAPDSRLCRNVLPILFRSLLMTRSLNYNVSVAKILHTLRNFFSLSCFNFPSRSISKDREFFKKKNHEAPQSHRNHSLLDRRTVVSLVQQIRERYVRTRKLLRRLFFHRIGHHHGNWWE